MAKPDSTACLHCGKAIAQTKGHGRIKKYCDVKCRSANKRHKKGRVKDKLVTRCLHCFGIIRHTVKPGRIQKYCNKACCYAHYRATQPKPPKPQEIERACLGCGVSFIQRHTRQEWCSKKCFKKHTYAGKRITSITHTCAHCAKEYHPTKNARGMYCSRTCSHKDQGRRLKERAALVRAAKRTAWLEQNNGKYSELHYGECRVCNTRMGPYPGYATPKACNACCDKLGPQARHADVELLRSRILGRPCVVCGKAFIPLNNREKVCSRACNKQTAEFKEYARLYRKTDAARAAKRIENQTRKARKRGNGPVDRIDPIVLFERDKWRCYICKRSTPKRLVGHVSDNSAPTIDHVIPVSEGGPHTWDNVACCCRECNSLKSNKTFQRDLFIGNNSLAWAP